MTHPLQPSRRQLLKSVSAGFGYMAFSGLCSAQAANPMASRSPHFPAKAKRVIFACMRGGPSHVDTFDYKPALARDDGKNAPGKGNRKLMKSPWEFKQHGQSGLHISSLFPHLAKQADNLCVLNGMYADVPSHPECFLQLHTGSFQFVRPSMGAWVSYGLGTENQNLPGFITISPPNRVGGAQNYGSAFLPAFYQGTRVGEFQQSLKDATLPNLGNKKLSAAEQRRQLDLVQVINHDL